MQYTINPGSQGICPGGWHLPTDAEWTTLTTFLGGESIAGGKMKEEGTIHWLFPNTVATNSSGFNALPGGYKDVNGSFGSLTYDTFSGRRRRALMQARGPGTLFCDYEYTCSGAIDRQDERLFESGV